MNRPPDLTVTALVVLAATLTAPATAQACTTVLIGKAPAILTFWTSQHALALEHQREVEAKAVNLLESGEASQAARLLSAFSFSQAGKTLYHARRLFQLR